MPTSKHSPVHTSKRSPATGGWIYLCAGRGSEEGAAVGRAEQCLTIHSITELRSRHGPEEHAEGHRSAIPPSLGHVGADRLGEGFLRPQMVKRPPIGASWNDVEDAVPSARSAMDARCDHCGPADGPNRIEGACRLMSQLVSGEAVLSAAKP